MVERKQGLWFGYRRYPDGWTLATDQASRSRIEDYLAGSITCIDELEVEILPFNDFYGDQDSQPQQLINGTPLRQLRPFIQRKKCQVDERYLIHG